jgi:hypothetical protein
MNTSSEFIAELAAADEFVSHVRRLTSKQLRALARPVEDVRPTTPGDIDCGGRPPPCRAGFAMCVAPMQQRSRP